jgi:hypothetical protein
MLGTHFYYSIIKKNVVAFGTVFNNIEVVKIDPSTGNVIEQKKVPVAYGPKSKFLARLEQDPGTEHKVGITMPRISFEMKDIVYDSTRKTSVVQQYLENATSNKVQVQYMPVPYNLSFELGILAVSQDDALQILEQIIPFFQPAFTITVKLIPEMNEEKDLPIILNSIGYEDDYEGDMMKRRSITYTLSFTLKTYFYGPITTSPLIRSATVYGDAGTPPKGTKVIEYNVTPKALTDLNNDGHINSADDILVTPADNFGFNETLEDL